MRILTEGSRKQIRDFLERVAARLLRETRSVHQEILPSFMDSPSASFFRGFSRMARVVGRDRLFLSEEEIKKWEDFFSEGLSPPFLWKKDEISRGVLFFRAESSLSDATARREFTENLYFTGDNEEKRALLKAIPFVRSPEIYHDLAMEACRTNVVSVLSGIACESPYPLEFFSEREFNQMVVKAMTLGLDLERVFLWRNRNNRELYRMSQDYIKEREAAGRSFPEGNRLILEDYRRKHEVL